MRPCVRPAGHTKGFCNPFSDNNPFDPQTQKVEEKPEESSIVTLFGSVLKAAGIQIR